MFLSTRALISTQSSLATSNLRSNRKRVVKNARLSTSPSPIIVPEHRNHSLRTARLLLFINSGASEAQTESENAVPSQNERRQRYRTNSALIAMEAALSQDTAHDTLSTWSLNLPATSFRYEIHCYFVSTVGLTKFAAYDGSNILRHGVRNRAPSIYLRTRHPKFPSHSDVVHNYRIS